MCGYELVMANRVYSSWSLRVWLLFEVFDIEATRRVMPIYTDRFERFREGAYPARQLPTLLVHQPNLTAVVWDSLSITEFLHEQHPDRELWPQEPMARAAARSLCAEMHAGFMSLRKTMPMNLRRTYRSFTPDPETRTDIERVETLWRWARETWGGGGPYLFGTRFTAADAFFAPVAARFRTYGIILDGVAQTYLESLLGHPAVMAFVRAAQDEPWVMEHNEFEDS